jgi:hypothetical protein
LLSDQGARFIEVEDGVAEEIPEIVVGEDVEDDHLRSISRRVVDEPRQALVGATSDDTPIHDLDVLAEGSQLMLEPLGKRVLRRRETGLDVGIAVDDHSQLGGSLAELVTAKAMRVGPPVDRGAPIDRIVLECRSDIRQQNLAVLRGPLVRAPVGTRPQELLDPVLQQGAENQLGADEKRHRDGN